MSGEESSGPSSATKVRKFLEEQFEEERKKSQLQGGVDFIEMALTLMIGKIGEDYETYLGTSDAAEYHEQRALESLKEKLGKWAGVLTGEIPLDNKGFREWYLGLPQTDFNMLVELLKVVNSTRRIRQQHHNVAAVERGRKHGREKRTRAWGIIQAGAELIVGLLANGKPVTAKALFDAFKPHTMKEPRKVFIGDVMFEVWRDGNHLYEQRRMPPGVGKQVKFSTFQKKPYYFAFIRRVFSP